MVGLPAGAVLAAVSPPVCLGLSDAAFAVCLFGIMGYAWPVIPLLSGILFGLFGTRIYFARVEQEMNRVRRLSAVNRRIEYADKGGVRIGQALSMAAVSALFLAGILSAIYY